MRPLADHGSTDGGDDSLHLPGQGDVCTLSFDGPENLNALDMATLPVRGRTSRWPRKTQSEAVEAFLAAFVEGLDRLRSFPRPTAFD